jgi:hypothetical protein
MNLSFLLSLMNGKCIQNSGVRIQKTEFRIQEPEVRRSGMIASNDRPQAQIDGLSATPPILQIFLPVLSF